MDSQLSSFIAHARTKGMDFQTIKSLLMASGWKERDVQQALVSETLDQPIPVPPDVGGAREAFLHLLSFVCLYISLGSLVFLYFTCLEWLFPDAAFDSSLVEPDWSGLRWQMAMIIVSFPIFVWVSRLIAADIRAHAEKARSALRRWLTYLTLLITALILIGDAITLVWYLLEGELTVRFILKVLVVLILAGITFVYYLMSLRTGGSQQKWLGLSSLRVLETTAWVMVLGGIIWAFMLVGNPGTQRERRFDDQRVTDLQAITNELTTQVRGEQKPASAPTLLKPIPKTLQALSEAASYQRLQTVDPETAAPYEYIVKDADTVQLCATFSLERKSNYNIAWDHPAGRTCFTIDLLSLQYPVPVRS